MISSGVISLTIGMLPAMKITEPYSPSARAKASAKPVSSAGITIGKITRREGLPAVGAQRGGGFLQFAVQVFQHRLHRAHHEGQADEDQRHPHAQRREADLEGQPLADPAVLRVERGQRDAGHGGGQREGQVDQRVDQRLPGSV
jgi:hypothetical protein